MVTRREFADWRTVRDGLKLLLTGNMGMAASALTAGVFVAARAPGMVILSVLGVLGFAITVLVGNVKCLSVPARTNLKPYIVTVLVCGGLMVATAVASYQLEKNATGRTSGNNAGLAALLDEPTLTPDEQRQETIYTMVNASAQLVGIICALLFLRGIGLVLENPALVRGVVRLFALLGVLVASAAVFVAVGGAVGTPAVLIAGIALLAAAIWYLALLAQARRTIDRMFHPGAFATARRAPATVQAGDYDYGGPPADPDPSPMQARTDQPPQDRNHPWQ